MRSAISSCTASATSIAAGATVSNSNAPTARRPPHRGPLGTVCRLGARPLRSRRSTHAAAPERFVVHPHACTAPAAQHATLEQGGALARHASALAGREAQCSDAILTWLRSNSLPGDVARVGVADQDLPVRVASPHAARHAARVASRARAAVDEGPRVARVVQDLITREWSISAPQQFALADAATDAAREQHLLSAQTAHHGSRPSRRRGRFRTTVARSPGPAGRDRARRGRRRRRPSRPAAGIAARPGVPC